MDGVSQLEDGGMPCLKHKQNTLPQIAWCRSPWWDTRKASLGERGCVWPQDGRRSVRCELQYLGAFIFGDKKKAGPLPESGGCCWASFTVSLITQVSMQMTCSGAKIVMQGGSSELNLLMNITHLACLEFSLLADWRQARFLWSVRLTNGFSYPSSQCLPFARASLMANNLRFPCHSCFLQKRDGEKKKAKVGSLFTGPVICELSQPQCLRHQLRL